MSDTVTKVRRPSTGGQDRSFPVPPRSYSSDRLCDLMGCRGCLTITDLQSVQQNVKRVQTGMRPASNPHFPKLEVVFCIDLASSKAPRVLAFDQFIDLRQSRSFRSSLDSGGLDQKHNSSFSFRLFCFRASSPPHTVAGFRNKFPEASSELVSIGGLQFQADRLGSPFQIVGEMKPSAVISTETVRNPETTTRPQVTDPPTVAS